MIGMVNNKDGGSGSKKAKDADNPDGLVNMNQSSGGERDL